MGRILVALAAVLLSPLPSTEIVAQVWLDLDDVTASNLLADDPAVGGPTDAEEKDFLAVDIDLDGDADVIVVRKTPADFFGPKVNVLFLNNDGVLTDSTDELAPDLAIADNSRDVQTGDFDGDGWPDVIVALTGTETIDGAQPRIYMNLGEDGSGNWLGLDEDPSRLPFMESPTGRQPNFGAVAVGDVTNDGFPDLYFIDYRNDLEDKLLINDGNGFFTDETDDRLPAGFELSADGITCQIVDINTDGDLDIVKNVGGSICIAYNDGTGEFVVEQELPTAAPYHFTVGDLNADGKADVFVSDDNQDQFKLNTSAPGEIPVSWQNVTLSDSPLTTGFGGNVHIADLDGDNDEDVIVTDFDTIFLGCDRRLAFLENNGGAPTPSIFDPYDAGTLLPAHHNGTYDVAIADFNDDGAKDLLIGHCGGNSLYFQVVPAPPVPPVSALTCLQNVFDVELQWTNAGVYDALEVRRDGDVIAALPGTATDFVDPAVADGSHSYSVIASVASQQSPATSCVIVVSTVNAITDLTCAQSDADVFLSWTNNDGIGGEPYDEIIVSRDAVVIEVLAGTATSFVDVAPPLGITSYTLTAAIGADTSAATGCVINIAPTGATDLILDLSTDDAGDTDSAAALETALVANQRVVNRLILDDVSDLAGLGVDLNDFERIWVPLGTFPNNHVLDDVEGAILADYVEDGIGGADLYLSGGDTFCFDAQTEVHDLTGVGVGCSDGFGSVGNVEALPIAECLFLTLPQVGYDGEDDFIDRLSPLTTATPLVRANVGGSEFNTGVVNSVGDALVISQSVELGGVGADHDRADLIDLYLHCFPSTFDPPVAEFSAAPLVGNPPLEVQFTSEATGEGINDHAWLFGDGLVATIANPTHTYTELGSYTVTYTVTGPGGSATLVKQDYIQVVPVAPEFRRGDSDADGTFNGLADALHALGFQFLGGPPPPCMSAADADDDGTFNGLADGLYMLAYQFLAGAPPPAPGPVTCGQDPTLDALGCASYPCP